MNKNVSKKIIHINFILVLLIVILHSNCLRFISDNNFMITKIYKIISVMCDASVPAFFILSAYLFYRNFDFSKIKEKYKSRFFSLVIPYFFWSIFFLIYYELICLIPKVNTLFNNTFELGISHIFQNILMANCAEGMWFVRDLIIYSFLAPVIYFIMKKSKKLNYIIMLICLTVNLIFKFGYSNPIFWLPIYLFGANMGIHSKDYDIKENIVKNKKSKLPIFIILYILFAIIVSTFEETSRIYYIYRMLSPIILLAIFDMLSLYKYKIYNVEKISFFIYCIHLPVIKVVRKILFIILGYNSYISIIVYILTTILTVWLIQLISKIINKMLPKFYKLITGSR
ncbi:TPA: acyltransferase [Enterococcus faecium]|nr:acyltransferase [Enterococcus faecium]